MKTKDILNGIEQASTRQELQQHLDNLEAAIVADRCDYGAQEWLEIASAVDSRNSEFNQRVFH
ncbi:MAG: hypothetical protein ACR2PH_10705 [Desulfobulbia bacterium]